MCARKEIERLKSVIHEALSTKNSVGPEDGIGIALRTERKSLTTLVAATAAENSALVELSAVTWCRVYAKGMDFVKESEVCLVGPPSEGLRTSAII